MARWNREVDDRLLGHDVPVGTGGGLRVPHPVVVPVGQDLQIDRHQKRVHSDDVEARSPDHVIAGIAERGLGRRTTQHVVSSGVDGVGGRHYQPGVSGRRIALVLVVHQESAVVVVPIRLVVHARAEIDGPSLRVEDEVRSSDAGWEASDDAVGRIGQHAARGVTELAEAVLDRRVADGIANRADGRCGRQHERAGQCEERRRHHSLPGSHSGAS